MKIASPQAVVAGHICLDVIPAFPARPGTDAMELTPGKLVNVGAAVLSAGGAVSNTGLALHRLGVPATLVGRIGDDLLGQGILEILRGYDPALAAGMKVVPGEATSYSVVVSPPHTDRTFLHCPGTNDTFTAADVEEKKLASARLFHFGYPPLMKTMYADQGKELARLFKKVKAKGLTTSLDMAQPDPDSPAGQADWPAILQRVLPHVDIFLPSVDELLYMLNRKRHAQLIRKHGSIQASRDITGELLDELARPLLSMGVAVVIIKLGDQGLYMRTTNDPQRLARMGACAPQRVDCWLSRELYIPCFKTDVVGTTGSGDCTIAGFLAALLRGDCPPRALTAAVAVGACSVEAADATSGIPVWSKVQRRIHAGWPSHPLRLKLPGWKKNLLLGLQIGPHDLHKHEDSCG